MVIIIQDTEGKDLHSFKLPENVSAALDNLRLKKIDQAGVPLDASTAEFIETIVFDVYNAIVAQHPQLLPDDEKQFLADLEAQAKAWQQQKILVAREAARVEKTPKGK